MGDVLDPDWILDQRIPIGNSKKIQMRMQKKIPMFFLNLLWKKMKFPIDFPISNFGLGVKKKKQTLGFILKKKQNSLLISYDQGFKNFVPMGA